MRCNLGWLEGRSNQNVLQVSLGGGILLFYLIFEACKYHSGALRVPFPNCSDPFLSLLCKGSIPVLPEL